MDDDHTITARSEATASVERERRRFARYGDAIPVATLAEQSYRSAELQLLDAREALKDARRRVVQLEDAVEGWRALREEMLRAEAAATRAVAN
jgi:hypothetical protein